MILFKEDWDYYPSATPHFETTNKSFLKLAKLYSEMGVDNNLFLLALLHDELRYVDPFSPELSEDQKTKIIVECRYNPWYYFREVVRLPAGAEPVRFHANRGNISLIWSFYNHIDYMLIQPRQTGKSGSTDCISVNLMYFSMSGGKISLITKDDALRKANIERLKAIRDNLPAWTWQKTRDDADNQTELTYNLLGNSYVTAVSQKTESGALNIGRGNTAQVSHTDEPPFCANIDITLPAALAAGTKAREFAAANNQPYANIFTTTAGKKDTREGKYIYDMLMDGTPFDENFYDAVNLTDLRNKLKRKCAGDRLLINGTWSYDQLGLTREWLFEALANSGAKGEEADRDFFNRWTSGSLSSPLSTELNNAILASEMAPCWSEYTDDDYCIDWFIPENKFDEYISNTHLVAGLDTSNAVGRDSIALIIVDIRDLSVVGSSVVNETNLINYGNFVADLLIRFRNLTLVIENKSSAQTMIDKITIELPKHGIDPFRRLFNYVVDQSGINKEFQSLIQTTMGQRGRYFYDSIKGKLGFQTTGATRDALYKEILPEAAKMAHAGVRFKTLSAEIRSLVVKNGKIDHKASGHDDTVIAWLMVFWFIMRGANLSHYGIASNLIRSRVSTTGMTKEEHMDNLERKLQARYREELDEKIAQLKTESNSFTISKLEHRIGYLTCQIRSMGGETISIDVILNEAREERRRHRARSSNHARLARAA